LIFWVGDVVDPVLVGFLPHEVFLGIRAKFGTNSPNDMTKISCSEHDYNETAPD